MDEYNVIVTDHAFYAMAAIRDYIALELSNPTAAATHLRLFRAEIKTFSVTPKRNKRIEEQPWHDEGVRKTRVRNYYIYYWVAEDEHAVYVTDIIYVGSDQVKRLEQMPLK